MINDGSSVKYSSDVKSDGFGSRFEASREYNSLEDLRNSLSVDDYSYILN